ncbi:MAG: PAS domain-containing protein [Deltaproteobacteria bacterium]|nr:PAS domain-containing protein [Deltaproteobacteria bacterium]
MAKEKPRPAKSFPERKSATALVKSRLTPQAAEENPAFPIIGLGASAGGLEALERFFAWVPLDIGMAFIIVPHLDPDHASLMTELLRRVTQLEVSEAQDGVQVKPNRVYVIPPNKDLSLYQRTIHLETPAGPRGLRMPINSFFRSLAEDQGELATAIILSGTGTDGTQGLRAIHGAGGMVMVQTPDSAKYPGMPHNAIQTGLVDYVLPPEKMPSQLARYGQRSGRRSGLTAAKEVHLQKILALVRSRTGHDFSLYKKTTIQRRIERRMSLHGIEDLSDYQRYLQENPGESRLLFNDFLIGVTQFFRDPEAFEALEKVLRKTIEDGPEVRTFRAWIPGCGTGEEAYSVAMVIREGLDEVKRNWKVQIFGTDIDDEGINRARSGIYSNNIVEDVPPDRLKRFFIKLEDDSYRVKKEIREMIVFAVQDLAKDPPFTKLDLLSCRNLLIYFEAELQSRLLPRFHYSLRPGGILFLGASETIGKFTDLFAVSDRKWKIYRTKKTLSPVREEIWGSASWVAQVPSRFGEGGALKKAGEIDIIPDVRRKLLETFVPPSAVVNAQGELLYLHGPTGKYLELPRGHPNWSIFDMARDGLQFELRSGIRFVLTELKERRYVNLKVKTTQGYQPVNLTIKPFATAPENQGLALVTFEEIVEEEKRPPDGKSRPPEGETEKRSQVLEQELAYTRESLEGTIEELQTANEEARSANEEMQSTNEELQSANEELETSREELQSMNEELLTLNTELQEKIELLSQAEKDVKILLDNTRIGIIFLDNQLGIQRFTSEATKIFSLIPGDVGRPLQHIRSNLDADNIEEDTQEVLETLQSREKEVRSQDGTWYLMRIIPDRPTEKGLAGLVLSFTDITEMKHSAEAVNQLKLAYQAAHAFSESIVETVREPLLVLDEELRVVSANRSFYRTFLVSREETEGRLIYDLGHQQWDLPDLKRLLGEILTKNSEFDDFLVEQEGAGLARRRLMLNARKVVQREGGEKGLILLAIEDVTNNSAHHGDD